MFFKDKLDKCIIICMNINRVMSCVSVSLFCMLTVFSSPHLSSNRNVEEVLFAIPSSDEDFDEFPPWSSRDSRYLYTLTYCSVMHQCQ